MGRKLLGAHAALVFVFLYAPILVDPTVKIVKAVVHSDADVRGRVRHSFGRVSVHLSLNRSRSCRSFLLQDAWCWLRC